MRVCDFLSYVRGMTNLASEETEACLAGPAVGGDNIRIIDPHVTSVIRLHISCLFRFEASIVRQGA
jgi:hypothetical protein